MARKRQLEFSGGAYVTILTKYRLVCLFEFNFGALLAPVPARSGALPPSLGPETGLLKKSEQT